MPPEIKLTWVDMFGKMGGRRKGVENDNDGGDNDDDDVYYTNDGELKVMMTMITIIKKLTAVKNSRHRLGWQQR